MEELPGILTLALDAYADALQEGFTMPESCKQARDQWRLEADQVAQFIEQDCEASHLERLEPQRLFNGYRDWAADNGIHNRLTQKSFIDRVVILGFERKKSNGKRFIVGLKCNRRGEFYD
jgi:putative DNA primase/helicase